MGILDIYYRAFKEYRKETADSTQCGKDRNEFIQSNAERDKLEAMKYLCTVEEDWVSAIEEGLVFVEKAVAEERQFIRTNGEVVPIEKVKRISKDSVEHLAKHSEMITHVPEEEGDPVIPDKLYMTEKLSDYAVYENRFLYMMLCYLRDFIQYRLEKIEDLRRTYRGEMEIDKEIVSKKRKLVLKATVLEERTDNPFPIADEKSAAMVQRIKDCNTLVLALLGTDLMVQVAKSPMIKPPIVKTNVLKMNNNFKRALALYDYIASYKGKGYSYEEVKYNYAPFTEAVGNEIAEAANLTAFLSYKIGNDIEDVLERNYRNEEERRKAEAAKKLAERIKRLKKRALESNKTLEEYMLLLEERNRQLEKDSEELVLVRHEVEKLHAEIEALEKEKEELLRRIDELNAVIEEKNAEIAALNRKYIEDMLALKNKHEEELAALNAEHERQMQELRTAHEEELVSLRTEFADRLQATIEEYESKADALREEIERAETALSEAKEEYAQRALIFNERIEKLTEEKQSIVDECERRIREQEENSAALLAERDGRETFLRAQLDAERVRGGQLAASTDDTTRERFLELQAEFAAFERYFREQWNLTKKEIRKQVLWKKQEKKSKKSGN